MTLDIVSFLGEIAHTAESGTRRQSAAAAVRAQPTARCALEIRASPQKRDLLTSEGKLPNQVHSHTQCTCPPPAPVCDILDASAHKHMPLLAQTFTLASLRNVTPWKNTRHPGKDDIDCVTVSCSSQPQAGSSITSQAKSLSYACTRKLSNPYQIVATVLGQIAQANDTLLARCAAAATTSHLASSAMMFAASKLQGNSKTQPSIPLSAYAARLARLAPLPAPVLVAALIFVDRVSLSCPGPQRSCSGLAADCAMMVPPLIVCYRNMHRVLLITLSIAAKFHLDAFYCNRDWARVGGISLAEFNRLELEFLRLIGYNLNVSSAEYSRYCDRLTVFAAKLKMHIDSS